MRLRRSLKIGLSAGLITLTLYSCKDEKTTIKKPLEVTFKKEGTLKLFKKDSLITTLDIEIADDEYEIQTGLMYRSSMENNHAMLFIFPNERPRSFYMKNTRIPLDIIYFNADKELVSIQKNAKPFDETSLPSDGVAQYVLEVNAGLTEQWQLEKGDSFNFNKD